MTQPMSKPTNQSTNQSTNQQGNENLALDGGAPVRTTPFPSVGNASGRTLGAEELAALTRVLASGQLNSTVGGETRRLEGEFADYYAIEHALASSSGTAALHLAVGAIDPEPGDEIITTPISDAGTVLPMLMQNAVPVFADVDPRTGNLDVESVRACITERTRAIFAVHLFGSPAPVAALRELADAHGILLVEDCAQAYLTRCPDGRLAGTVGHIGCFSLQQSKHITAGDGGLCVTADAELARRMRLFADKGWPRDTDERTHLFLSTNYRMTELQAAVARAQLPKLAGVVDDRRGGARRLTSALASLAGLAVPPHDGMSYWQYPLVVDPALAGGTCHDYGKALAAEGIPANGGYLNRPLYRTPVLADRRTYGQSGYPLQVPPARVEPRYDVGLCPEAERLIGERLLVISWNERYTDADVDDIAAAVRKVHHALTRSR
ncbi:DegT/DnrJ/EryC1/StrS family aminotransferase [Actinopolymorpha pittospori]